MSELAQGRNPLPKKNLTVEETITAGTGLTVTTGNITAGTGNFVGKNALYRPTSNSITSDARASMTGTNNTAYGHEALLSNTSGANNTAFGFHALRGVVTGQYNTAFGRSALSGATGNSNSAFGYTAGISITSGIANSIFGYAAGDSLTEGSWNTIFGATAGNDLTTGQSNTFLGNNAGKSVVTGSSNIMIGVNAGRYETGSNSLYIDNRDRTDTAGDKANAIIYGVMAAEAASQELRFNVGKMGFYATSPQSKPTLVGARDDGEGALKNLVTSLAALGLLTDSTTSSWLFKGQTYSPGQAVLSIRFDDIHERDYDYVYPLFMARGMVGGFAVVEDWIGGVNRVTLAQLLEMQAAGNEMMGHSKTHGDDPVDYDEFEEEVKSATNRMRMIGLNIVNFVCPGTWNDSYPTGYKVDSTDFYGSPEDLLLRAEFKAYEAYLLVDHYDGGYYHFDLPRSSVWGVRHASGDRWSLATLQDYIDDMITSGYGGELLFHSTMFDRDGYLTKANFENFLDYVATKVTAGDLKVMTPTQQLYATEAA